jgi:hypothetical protein
LPPCGPATMKSSSTKTKMKSFSTKTKIFWDRFQGQKCKKWKAKKKKNSKLIKRQYHVLPTMLKWRLLFYCFNHPNLIVNSYFFILLLFSAIPLILVFLCRLYKLIGPFNKFIGEQGHYIPLQTFDPTFLERLAKS